MELRGTVLEGMGKNLAFQGIERMRNWDTWLDVSLSNGPGRGTDNPHKTDQGASLDKEPTGSGHSVKVFNT